MRRTRVIAALVAAVAIVAIPGVAHAATIAQQFRADSGDACPYGVTTGTLSWHIGSTSPLPFLSVDVVGKLTDRPTPADPSTACRDDGYHSTATFTAYAGTVAIDRQARTVNNDTVSFSFTLGRYNISGWARSIDRVVIQVCRDPIVTLPPSYCGRPMTYLAPPIA